METKQPNEPFIKLEQRPRQILKNGAALSLGHHFAAVSRSVLRWLPVLPVVIALVGFYTNKSHAE